MKIALATDWFAPRRGGIESQLTGLAQGLAEAGHEVDVITSTPGASDGKGYRVIPLRTATVPGLDLALSPTLIPELRTLLRGGYDIVHAHISVVSPVAYAAAAVAANASLPTVVTFHSVLRAKRLLLRAASALFPLADRPVSLAAVSRMVAAQVHGAVLSAPVEILSNGIDVGFWQQAAAMRVDASFPERPVRFISAMRLHAKKRPRELLRAFAAAVHGAPVRATLTFVGDGPERAALARDAAQFGLADDRIRFCPWATPAELRSLYAESDVFVSACEREAFGIAALEARVAGLPVIAMRVAGSTEFLHDGEDALLCDDDASLLSAIRRCTADGALRQRLAAASTSLAHYDWPVVIAAHEAVYGRAIQRAAARSVDAR